MAVASIAELESVAKVTARLRALLQHARGLKDVSTVEPPLPTAELVTDVDGLHDDMNDTHDQTYRFFTVETAVRELFYDLVYSTDIEAPAFVEIWNLLDVTLLCGDRGKCTPELVCWLLEELLDSQTTLGCRTVFDYLESRRERLARKDFHKKNLIFLRSCNELLRRLSRAEDAIFCGRVFFFLFQTFPLGDKSSVNLRGEFHVENTTKFEVVEAAAQDGETEEMEVDGESTEPPARSENGVESADAPVKPTQAANKSASTKSNSKKTAEEETLSSSDLYPVFWKLQHDFSDPTRLYTQSNFAAFKDGLEKTITKFKKTPTVVQTKAVEEDERGTKRKVDENSGIGSDELLVDNYNPKYLTSPDLFDLELSDLAFQRHILVQALILIDFLLSLTEKAKRKVTLLPSVNKSMLYNFTLSDDDSKWAASTRSTITAYLCLTQEGRQYCRMVETVLARDKNWVRWKIESCPSIVRGPVATEEEMAARKSCADTARPRRVPERPMGMTMDLRFLDEGEGGGLDALRKPSRYTVPSIEALVEGVRTDKLDAEMAMDDEERVGLENAMANKKWRAVRQARAANLSLLDQVEPGRDLEEIFGRGGGSTTTLAAEEEEDEEEEETNHGEGPIDEHGSAVAVAVTLSADEVTMEPTMPEGNDKIMDGVEEAA